MSRGEVFVPANLDMADKILFNLTARQVIVLAPVALALFATWRSLLDAVPVVVLLIATAPVAAAAFALAMGKKDGATLDRLAIAALKQPRRPIAAGEPHPRVAKAFRRLVSKTRGVPTSIVKAVRGPVKDLSDAGVINLGSAGYAIATDVGFVNFGLRSIQEREVLVAAFARLLRSTDASLQVTVSTRPVDLTDYLAAMNRSHDRLPAGRLRQAAQAHHLWLSALMDHQQLLRREITAVVTCPDAESVQWAARQVDHAAQALGITARRLEGTELAARIRRGIDPYATTHQRSH